MDAYIFMIVCYTGFGMMGRHGNIIEDLQEYRVSYQCYVGVSDCDVVVTNYRASHGPLVRTAVSKRYQTS